MPDSSNHPLFQYYCHSLPYGSVREYGKPPSVINTVLYSRTHLYRRCRAGRDKIRTIRVQCGHRAALGIHGNRNVAQTNLISINLDPGPSHSLRSDISTSSYCFLDSSALLLDCRGSSRNNADNSSHNSPIQTVTDVFHRAKRSAPGLCLTNLIQCPRISLYEVDRRLQIGVWNARSLNNKITVLCTTLIESKLDVLGVTEMWLKGNSAISEFRASLNGLD